MRIYENLLEMYSETKRDLHEMGIRVHPQTMQDLDVADKPEYETLELSPCIFMVLKTHDTGDLMQQLGLNQKWLVAEMDDRWRGARGLVGVNPGEAWELRRETWEPFIHDGQFAYTYSERFGRPHLGEAPPYLLLERVIHELHERPDTRQAVLPMFDPLIDVGNMGGTARIPCTMYYQFLRRRGELDMVYTMRSSDFATHFPYDILLAVFMQARIASVLDVPVGRFTFFTGSLHLYRKDADPGTF